LTSKANDPPIALDVIKY